MFYRYLDMRFFSVVSLLLPVVSAWKALNGHIHTNNGTQVHLRGLSWFGFETPDYVVNGLWSNPMSFYMNTIEQQGFNVLRVPFSSEWIHYNKNIQPSPGMVASDYENQNKPSIQILDKLFDYAEEKGILIMLDLHRLHKEYISELWYSPTDSLFTSETFYDTWFWILDRYHARPNLFAIDLLNEPHGRATWGTNDPSTDWKLFVENSIPRFMERYSDDHWLFLVEGINWGGHFDYAPLNVNTNNRLVYSAHTYGASVVPGINIYDVNGLIRGWDGNFGFIRDRGDTVMIGEWGGRTDLDVPWMKALASYLRNKDMTDNFFWSLGPNSGDVHGLLLDDWKTIDWTKQDIINSVVPEPTKFAFNKEALPL